MANQISPLAFVHPEAKLGDGNIIGPFCYIDRNTVIGDNEVIHSGSVIGADACYFQKRPDGWVKFDSCGKTVIGNDVEIGCCVCIDRGVSGDTFVGNGCKFDNFVQVGHDTYIGHRCLFGAHSAIAGCSRIEDECVIWAKSVINKDLTVAKRTTLLALSAIDKNVTEEGTVLFGTPAIDARRKWREMACTRQLPEMADEIYQLKKELAELKEQLKK